MEVMSVVNMVRNIKDLFPDYIVLVKIGTFFESYNNDAYIMSYIFQYKLKTLISYDTTCGFPTCSINRIKSILESRSVNYLIVDKKHNYEEIEKMNYKKKNKYNEILPKANEYIDRINRIDKIHKYLNNNPDKIQIVEEVLYER